MYFKKLEDKCLYYRGLTDYKIMPNTPIIAMLDGRAFSQLVKHKFKLPFDEAFIKMMNKTAQALCQQIQGCKLAYVQSDEISLLITDFDTPNSDTFFGGRLCKMQSILSSIATAEFNRQLLLYEVFEKPDNWSGVQIADLAERISKQKLAQFDCKVWPVPNGNDAFAWFLYRQIDCIRNSKQQTAQTYLSHKTLMGHDAEQQIEMLKERNGIDWNEFEPSLKYGRFIYKELKDMVTETVIRGQKQTVSYQRNVWEPHPAFPLSEEGGKEKFYEIVPILGEC